MIVRGDQHIAIAGAGGWIGLATLDLLEQALGDALAERISCYGSTERSLTLRSGRQVQQRPLSQIATLNATRIWLLHFAFLNKDRAEAMSEDAYRTVNDTISATVLNAVSTLPVEAAFVASSGAASKVTDPFASPAMRLYGQMKLDDEARFADWAEGHGRRAVISRIFNITGPYINKHQAYAIANFIMDALADRPIAVRAPREVFRAYVAIRELMSLGFALMADRSAPVIRFDSGGEAMELGRVAQNVAQVLNGGSVNRTAITDAQPDRYVGDDRVYTALRHAHGVEAVPLSRQILETADYMRGLVN
ncbi:NAD-dependent epimerase/dehydratase family protein [Sphingobium sp. BYY-5]|uniref:NAD-dependent epimerase/dehydratase family protein n=1 Tax=Sphingobium sp. BYY-5 TaxID=2926400 RepID=UPI001FA7A379|nr:NAD-dependent epimerase/dehydratase family protein [Sphingobium sp. BYY-5]MCI4590449.1 NAD-dependent epimerase/dehydratase family protein [Sphingobium sp. BYY-5]